MTAKKLLIVDDDEDFCFAMSRVQKRAGFSVFTATTIEQATEIAKEQMMEYAVVDLKIAHQSGLELIELLLKINHNIRIVILTGYASIATAVEAIKLGAIQYLTKPTDANEISNALLGDAKNNAIDGKSGNTKVKIPNEPMSVKRLEWEHLQKVLTDHKGNVSATAKALDMHRRTLQRKLQKYPVREKELKS
jgi:two-component system response regulator RegA